MFVAARVSWHLDLARQGRTPPADFEAGSCHLKRAGWAESSWDSVVAEALVREELTELAPRGYPLLD